MQKPKKYDWADTNLALFGSDTDKQVKKESAQTEPAWKGAGQKVGLEIWRINKFKVEHWPKEDYGKFYNGDSYIILNTYQEPDTEGLLYDVHFWIGQYSSQDEYGTAAYKTVELDTLLDDKPIQHREVMDYESSLFKSYFPTIELLEGGVDSGFRHVEINKQEYTPRLLHFHGDKKGVKVKEVPRCKKSIDETDVHIFDMGSEIKLWIGKKSNKDEKFKAVQYLQKLKSDRSGRTKESTIDQYDSDYEKLVNELPDEVETEESEYEKEDADFVPVVYRLSDASGQMEFTKEAEGHFPEVKNLDQNDVFIFDTGKELWVWIGRGSTSAESKNAMPRAHEYLKSTKHPLISVTCIKDGEPGRANSLFHAMLQQCK